MRTIYDPYRYKPQPKASSRSSVSGATGSTSRTTTTGSPPVGGQITSGRMTSARSPLMGPATTPPAQPAAVPPSAAPPSAPQTYRATLVRVVSEADMVEDPALFLRRQPSRRRQQRLPPRRHVHQRDIPLGFTSG